ncbi:NAD(P)H-binding protein [Allokutzneria multivorans]|uniref:NAD(P)H-binding protein n=1 Tax=Allokutzneria multivorans TaxID=1142134 RepID=A0ABP7QZC0_9PSEU
MTILVTGATGTIGSAVVEELLRRGHRVRALTRDAAAANLPGDVEVVEGDLTEPETVEPALRGVTAVHLLSATGSDVIPLATGPRLVELARRAGVRRVTVLATGTDGPVEQALRESDLEWTVLLPIDVMSNTLGWAQSIRDAAVVEEPYGARRTASVDIADFAAVVATVLANGGHAGKSYRVTGPEGLTPADKVRAISAATGRELGFTELTDEQARGLWRSQGWPEEGIDFMLTMWATVPATVGVPTSVVQDVTGRQPRTFADWAAENASLFV